MIYVFLVVNQLQNKFHRESKILMSAVQKKVQRSMHLTSCDPQRAVVYYTYTHDIHVQVAQVARRLNLTISQVRLESLRLCAGIVHRKQRPIPRAFPVE